jgi:hypothetical protein
MDDTEAVLVEIGSRTKGRYSMKCCGLTWKEWLALGIGVAALAGIVIMFQEEGKVILENADASSSEVARYFQTSVLPGMQNYSMAIGGILLAVSIAYILLGAEDDIATTMDEQELKK